MYRDHRSRQADLASSSSSSPPLPPLDASDDPPSSPTPLPLSLSLSLRGGELPSSYSATSSSSLSRHLRSPTLSAGSDPFSGSAKASLQSHPSFSKEELRNKHLIRRGVLPSSSSIVGVSSPAAAAAATRDDTLASHFHDSSDDAPYSSDDAGVAAAAALASGHLIHNMTSNSDSNSNSKIVGLGLASSSQQSASEDVSELPTLWGHLQQHQAQRAAATTGVSSSQPSSSSQQQLFSMGLGEAFQEPRAKARARTFSRTQSSTTDPFSAGAGTGSHSPRVSSFSSRPKKKERPSGTSPKKLTRASAGAGTRRRRQVSLGLDEEDLDDDDDDDEDSQPWEQFSTTPNFARSQSQSKMQLQLQVAQNNRVDWDKVVNHVFEKTDGRIQLEGKNLERVHPLIGDLAKFVVLPPLSRTSSACNSPFNGKQRGGLSDNTSSSALELYLYNNSLRSLPSALFDLGANLRVLTVRQNNLTELPAAMGELRALRELNISSNQLRWLPAEMQRLTLDKLHFFPNPFVQPPAGARLSVRLPLSSYECGTSPSAKAKALFSRSTSFAMQSSTTTTTTTLTNNNITRRGIARHLAAADVDEEKKGVPSLVEVCLRRLLEPLLEQAQSGEAQHRPLLDDYEAGTLLSLKDGGLHPDLLLRLEAARRSITGTWSARRHVANPNRQVEVQRRGTKSSSSNWLSGKITLDGRGIDDWADGNWSSPSSSPSPSSPLSSSSPLWGDDNETNEQRSKIATAKDIEEQLDEGDDAARNPWFNRCPNPQHLHENRLRQPQNNQQQGRARTETGFSLNGGDAFLMESDSLHDWPRTQGPVFAKEGSQRIEWVSHVGGYRVASDAIRNSLPQHQQQQQGQEEQQGDGQGKQPQGQLVEGSGCLPILWRGCGPRCLDFLLS